MENSTQKIKFPVGAILMIAYAIWGILSLFVLDNHIYYFIGGVGILDILNPLLCVAIAIVAIMKKKGLPMLVPSAALALILFVRLITMDFTIYNYLYGSGYSTFLIIARILFLATLAFIVLLLLDDMKIGNLSAFRSIFVKGIVISVLLYTIVGIIGVSILVFRFYSFLRIIWEFSQYVLSSASLLLLGLWINDPYMKNDERENSGTSKDSLNNDSYIALGKHICLLIFTLGIWQMIWVYKTTQFTNSAKGEEERNPTTKLLLYLFVPFYSIYWTYKTAQRIDAIAKEGGIASDLGTICLILAIFIGIVPPILMQDKINQIVKKTSTEGNQCVSETVNAVQALSGLTEQLSELKNLLDVGIITQEEFDTKKKQLLGL